MSNENFAPSIIINFNGMAMPRKKKTQKGLKAAFKRWWIEGYRVAVV